MSALVDRKTVWAISALAGSSVGLLEAMLVMGRKTGLVDSILVLLDGALGYAACSLLIAAAWHAFPFRRGTREAELDWATAACIPAGIMAALLPITRRQVTGGAAEILLRILAAVALGVVVTLLLRAVVRRLLVLGRTSTWLAVHGITLLAAAVLFLLPVLAGGGPSAGQRGGRPNVLLITVDTLRADHVGTYGYAKARTPHMDQMAARGVQFLETVAPAPLTCPSHSSMLTGLYPVQHGALHNGTPLPSHRQTLARILAQNGYETGATVSGYSLDDDACGLGSHFGSYDDNFTAWWWLPDRATKIRLWDLFASGGKRLGLDVRREDRPAGRTTDLALSWLERSRHRPFFYWVHYFDPHTPYEPPAPYDKMHDPEYKGPSFGRWYYVPNPQKEKVVNDPRAVRHMIALYDGEISYVDDQLGRLFGALERWGLDQNTLVVLASDHGESLGEHDFYFEHSNYLYDEELRVPLIFTFPQGQPAGRRIAGQTRLIDIAPTLVDYLGLSSEVPMEGRSLRPLIQGDPTEASRSAFSAVHPGVWDSGRSIFAIRNKGYKLIWTSPEWRFFGMRLAPREELYDLSADPMELRNIAPEAPPVLDELRSVLTLWRDREVGTVTAADDEVKRRLRSLGYVN